MEHGDYRHPGVIYFMFLVRKFVTFGEFSVTISPFGGGVRASSFFIVKILKCTILLEFGAQSVSSLFIQRQSYYISQVGLELESSCLSQLKC